MEPAFTSMKWELMMQLPMLSVPAQPFTHSKLTVLQCCPSHSGGELQQVLTAHSRYLRQRPLKFSIVQDSQQCLGMMKHSYARQPVLHCLQSSQRFPQKTLELTQYRQ